MRWSELSPELRELAERVCTQKELDALKLWDPDVVGFRSVALALDISRDSARDRIRSALRKIEKGLREQDVA